MKTGATSATVLGSLRNGTDTDEFGGEGRNEVVHRPFALSRLPRVNQEAPLARANGIGHSFEAASDCIVDSGLLPDSKSMLALMDGYLADEDLKTYYRETVAEMQDVATDKSSEKTKFGRGQER